MGTGVCVRVDGNRVERTSVLEVKEEREGVIFVNHLSIGMLSLAD